MSQKNAFAVAAPVPGVSPQHYDYIDALRGLALIAVLAFHFGYAVHGLPTILSDVLGRGYAGVQLFFVVSSFTLCASLTARRQDRAALTAYFIRRVFRILPMFWFAIVLYIATYGLDPRWSALDGISTKQVVLAASLLHGFDPNAINGPVPGGWSVATEVQFYLLLPLLVAFATSLRRAIAIWIVLLATSIAAQPLIAHLLAPFYPVDQQDVVRQFAFYTLPAQAPVFASGIVLFRLMGPDRAILRRIETRLPADRRLRAIAVLALVLVAGFPVNLASPVPSLVHTFPGHIGYGILAALLVYVFATWPTSNTPVHHALRFVGRISYSAYLLHFCILDTVVLAMPESVTSQPYLYLAVLIVTIVPTTLFCAWLTYTLVEKPGIALGRRVIERLRAARAPVMLEQAPDTLLGQGAGAG